MAFAAAECRWQLARMGKCLLPEQPIPENKALVPGVARDIVKDNAPCRRKSKGLRLWGIRALMLSTQAACVQKEPCVMALHHARHGSIIFLRIPMRFAFSSAAATRSLSASCLFTSSAWACVSFLILTSTR